MAKWSSKWYMVNDKIVNDLVMEKKIYISPLTEVAKVNMSTVVLAGSPPDGVDPTPPIHPGAPRLQAPVLNGDSVPVF